MSSFLPERNALFLHIPRTGGRWVKKGISTAQIPFEYWKKAALDYRIWSHGLLAQYRGSYFNRIEYAFAFVRHPFAYYVSMWRFMKRSLTRNGMEATRKNSFSRVRLTNEAILRWSPNFDEWLEEMLEEEPGWVTRWFERYVGPNGGEFCHYIGRTETIERDMFQVMDVLGYVEKWKAFNNSISPSFAKKRRDGFSIMGKHAPFVHLTAEQRRKILRSERVMMRRFFGEDTINKRIYRNPKGEPI